MKYNTITFEDLEKYINDNNIPKNVSLVSDSGWECDPTGIRAVYYDKKENILYLYQDNDSWKLDSKYTIGKYEYSKVYATQLKESKFGKCSG